MTIQFNTDKNIQGSETLESEIVERVKQGLEYFDQYVSRVEIHLSDQNAHKSGGDDIKCTLEARIEGSQPIAVTSKDGDKAKAVDLAIKKMKAALDTRVGKLKEH
ncbi:HPF/RaiA family ribosome-associated protein [Crocinitomicaceae bacterium]|nr:HPF/RaiA family ribosome-associated protein [Crocinitomicaceae bacterium]